MDVSDEPSMSVGGRICVLNPMKNYGLVPAGKHWNSAEHGSSILDRIFPVTSGQLLVLSGWLR